MWFTLLLYALFASVFTVSKEALTHAAPFFLVGTRMTVAGLCMCIFAFLIQKKALPQTKNAWKKIFFLAICNIYLTNVFEFWGLQYLTSFKTCFIYSLSPFVSAILSYFLLGDSLSPKKWMGFLIGFIGFLPLLLSHTQEESQAGSLFYFTWAELAVVTATITAAYGWLVLKELVRHENLSPIVANGLSMAIGGLCALFHSRITETWQPFPIQDMMPFLKCTLFLIIVSNCICYNLYGSLLRRFSATFMSFAGLTTPLFTALFGWFFHGETTTISFWISFSVVCLGLVIFYQEELKQEVVVLNA